MDRIFEITRKQTQTSGVFYLDGKYYNLEPSNVEHEDGAITGTISLFEQYDPNAERLTVVKFESFRIEPDGTISRGAKLKKLLSEA